MEERTLTIPIGTKGKSSGILTLPEKGQNRRAIIVAHGAGNDMQTPLITSFCRGLAASGYLALRFNFLYTEHGRKAPDKQEVLVETWQYAFQCAREEFGDMVDSWIGAGKSMGGRVAAQMVAEKSLPVDGLIFLGYPLHPPGDKEKLRDAHLYKISVPMLFFAGTRDPLCNMDKLSAVLSNLRAPWDLHTLEKGDHSFHVPKSTGITEEEVHRQIIEKAINWLSAGQ